MEQSCLTQGDKGQQVTRDRNLCHACSSDSVQVFPPLFPALFNARAKRNITITAIIIHMVFKLKVEGCGTSQESVFVSLVPLSSSPLITITTRPAMILFYGLIQCNFLYTFWAVLDSSAFSTLVVTLWLRAHADIDICRPIVLGRCKKH